MKDIKNCCHLLFDEKYWYHRQGFNIDIVVDIGSKGGYGIPEDDGDMFKVPEEEGAQRDFFFGKLRWE